MNIQSLRFICVAIMLLLCLGSCNSTRQAPKRAFEAYALPLAPNYARPEAWSCHPETEDFADVTPPGVSPENQAAAKADVFFIHPTTFMGGLAWNASPHDRELNAKTDERAVKHQASVFNGSARVFVPRYRQMSLGGFFTKDTLSKVRALELAYSDVKAAFEYYLQHHNQGRPFLIAGHSQGALHGLRLMKELVDGKALQSQLVAAYLPGWPFTGRHFEQIPICESPTQTGCVLGWATWKKGAKPKSLDDFYRDAVVVNPISWRTDGSFAADSMHDGFLLGNYKKIKRQKLYAQTYRGILWVKSPFPLVPVKNYHIGDINLFWVDIRENVALRVRAHLANRSGTQSEEADD